MRIFFQIVIGLVALFIGIVAIGVTTAWWAVGTPSHAASTFVSTVASNEGALGVGDLVATDAVDPNDPLFVSVKEHRDQFVAAVASSLQGQQDALLALGNAGFTALFDGVEVKLEVTPLVTAIMAGLQAVDPQAVANITVPISIGLESFNGANSDAVALATVLKGTGWWWVAVLLLVIVLGLDALVGRRGGMRRWLIPSIFLAVPGLVWLVLSFIAPGAASSFTSNDFQAGLIKAGVSSVATKSTVLSLIVIVIAIVLFVLSLSIRGTRREAATVEAATVEVAMAGAASGEGQGQGQGQGQGEGEGEGEGEQTPTIQQ